MKKITILFLLLTVFTFVGYSQNVTTLIDFGQPGTTTAGNWNNVTDASTLSSATNLVDDNGASTGETLTLTDAFDPNPNSTGTTSPDGSLPFPSSATRDSFFGEDVAFESGGTGTGFNTEPTGGFTLSGLDNTKYYSFTIFASRTGVADNREALYTITGNPSDGALTATLDAANNTTNVATILNVRPTLTGEITIQVEKGTNNNNSFGFYYIGAIEMIKSDTTLSSETKSLGINGTVNVIYPSSREYIKFNFNLNEAAKLKMDVFDISGKKLTTILNENEPVGNFVKVWNTTGIASGIYILKINANGRTHNSKLILQ